MRKISTYLMVALILILTAQTAFATEPASPRAEQASEISVTIDGNEIGFDQPPVIINGRTLVPMRAIFEKFGCALGWNSSEKKVTASNENVFIQITIGENALYKDFNKVPMDVPAQIINGRTLVPVRAVSEVFGCTVDWNAASKTVVIASNGTIPKRLTDIEIKEWNGQSFNYDAILKGDLTQFAGVYQNGQGGTLNLKASGITGETWYEEDGKRYKEVAERFTRQPEGYYTWGVGLQNYDGPNGYVVWLYPVGVEVNVSGDIVKTDTSKIRLYMGHDFPSNDRPNCIYYRK